MKAAENTQAPNPNLDAALEWHHFGLRVVPIVPKNKRTAVKWKPWMADYSDELIVDHWQRFPNHDVGVLCTPDLFILDGDSTEALAAICEIENAHGIASNLVNQTSKGEHLYYRRAPGTIAQSAGFNSEKFPDKIDIRTARTMTEGCSLAVLTGPSRQILDLDGVATCFSELVAVDQAFIDAVCAHNGKPAPRERNTASVRASVPVTQNEAMELLSYVDPATLSYEDWVRVGMALHHEFEGSLTGLAIWDVWSQRDMARYDDSSGLEYRYNGFDSGRAGSVKLNTIAAWAREGGADLGAISRKHKEENEKVHIDSANPLSWIEDFTVSDEEMDKIADPSWALQGIAVVSQVTMMIGEPNAGKTTVFAALAAQMASDGFEVFYVNADTSGSDAKHYKRLANAGGYTLMLPDMKAGLSMKDVVKRFEAMNGLDYRYDKVVFIVDTLKKMTDVLNKQGMAELLRVLRGLSTKGLTLILLGHTNKYRIDGMPIYEGVGDIRADSDALTYMVPLRLPDGRNVVSLLPDKVRANMERVTFEINDDRTVTQLDYFIDTVQAAISQRKEANDQAAIDRIRTGILEVRKNKLQLREYCMDRGVSLKDFERVLKAYRGTYWEWVVLKTKNTHCYKLI